MHALTTNRRASGVLLHISSLPSQFGIGDLGPSAYQFVDLLAEAYQTIWQILPLHPTSPADDNSPYMSTSAFAENPLLISPDKMVSDNFLSEQDIERPPVFPESFVDFENVLQYKNSLFNKAYKKFCLFRNSDEEYEKFCRNNSSWLEEYALFAAISQKYGTSSWNKWPADLKFRDAEKLKTAREDLAEAVDREKFLQYIFSRQWEALHTYCTNRGIRIFGDIPLYVNYASADVWCNPQLFQLDRNLEPVAIAGVPPDYFSTKGQLWKNPLYSWEEHEKSGFSWWRERFHRVFSLVDFVRIDHFRGLSAYWSVPAGSLDATGGRWYSATGKQLLKTLKNQYPEFPIIAEDLGIITPDVKEMMDEFHIPGMRVLLFAFTTKGSDNPHQPHNIPEQSVVYTGTHDNLPVKGWFETAATIEEKTRLFRYFGREFTSRYLPHEYIRVAMMSCADWAILPLQDILELGADARMNTPGTDHGNWTWKITQDQLLPEKFRDLAEMTQIYARIREDSSQNISHE